MKVLVTGANGFVGQALCSVLVQSAHRLIRVVRTGTGRGDVPLGPLNEQTPWGVVLAAEVDVVVHLAGKVPVDGGPLDHGNSASFYATNTLATAHLARECAKHGVKRFVFVSTAKVLGEGQDQPYCADDSAVPSDDYAISKWEAEQALRKIEAETGMEVVVLRPPLVYGPGVKGNFFRLMQAVARRMPLPLGYVQNRRSLLYVGNLVSAIELCISHPGAVGQTFMISDGDDVSTPELLRRVAAALERRPFLLPVPVSWMLWASRLLGKQAAVDRLLGSLYVDISPLREELGWTPPYNMQAGLEATAQWYRKTKAVM